MYKVTLEWYYNTVVSKPDIPLDGHQQEWMAVQWYLLGNCEQCCSTADFPWLLGHQLWNAFVKYSTVCKWVMTSEIMHAKIGPHTRYQSWSKCWEIALKIKIVVQAAAILFAMMASRKGILAIKLASGHNLLVFIHKTCISQSQFLCNCHCHFYPHL